MLTPKEWEQIGKQAQDLYSQLELEIIEEIAQRIANVGYANTVVRNDIKIAQEMRRVYQEIIQLVAKYNHTTEDKIKNIFEEAGIKSLNYDDKIYKMAGLETIPLKQSTSMWQLLEATALKTNNNLNNLVMTTANTSQTIFYNAMNKAYMEVSTGVKSYTQSIIDTIKEVSKQGANIIYPSGRKLSLESAVRMNIVTGVNQTCGRLQLMRAEELEWDLMELTAHAGARPTHAKWQGQIVSRMGKAGYLSLEDVGYGTVTGFKGVNCRHDWRPYYEGSTRTYTDKELKEMANETVTYNGKQIGKYEASQIQRKIERQIRQDKKDIAGLQGSLINTNKDLDRNKIKQELEQAKLTMKLHNTTLSGFLEQTGFRKDYSRLTVGKQVTNSNNGSIIKKERLVPIVKEDKITVNNLLNKLNIDIVDYKPFGKYDPYENNIQEQVAKLIRKDKLPKVVSKQEYIQDKGREIARVVHNYHGKTAEQAYKNTIKGKIQYSEGTNSSYGRAIYFGEKEVSNNLLSFYGKEDNKIIHAKISNTAKIIEFENQLEYSKDLAKRLEKVPEHLKEFYKKESSLLYMLDGVDGISLQWNRYYCIYNREVLIISE